MQRRYIAPTIMLTAGAITIILNIIYKLELLDSLKRLLIVLLIFYIIGKIAEKIIGKIADNQKKMEDTSDSSKTESNDSSKEKSLEETVAESGKSQDKQEVENKAGITED
jgi:multisubunit Na+/H+ antiporter MnhG subunit